MYDNNGNIDAGYHAPTLPQGPTVTEIIAVASGVGAGVGADVLLARAAAAGVALTEGLVIGAAAAAAAGVVSAGAGGYMVGKVINEIPGVHEGAVVVVTAVMDFVNGVHAPSPQPFLPEVVSLLTPSQIANIVMDNPSEATYTSATDTPYSIQLMGLAGFGTGHDTSSIFLWP